MTTTPVLVALVAGLTLAGGGAAATALVSDEGGTTTPRPTINAAPYLTGSTEPPTGAGTPIAADEAGRIAVQHVGGGTVEKVEREDEDARHEWKVEVRNGVRTSEVHVDATTRAVTRVDDESDNDGADHDHAGDDGDG
jgi:uncharacterized membrane protein YkoI